MENNKQDDAKEKVDVEGSGGWADLDDPIVKAMESEFKGKPEEEFSAQGKSKFFWYTVIITHIIHRVLAEWDFLDMVKVASNLCTTNLSE